MTTAEQRTTQKVDAVAALPDQGGERRHAPRPLQQGDVLVLRDEDYLFGSGAMLMRVLVIYEFREVQRQPWVFLRGLELRADGHGRRVRDVLVRCGVLRTRRRRAK